MSTNTSLIAATRPVFAACCILIAVTLVFSVSCATKKIQYANAPDDIQQSPANAKAADREKRILDEYRRWRGTRHKLGGTGSKGIDCSGFVKAVYRDAFNIELPRTTKAQVRLGKSVSFKALQPGDLVFFKPPTYARHVGIYLSRSKFVHASKNKGVTVSRIDAHYWGKYYWTARRILPAH